MPKLYTIGHSNHTLKVFLELLHVHQIDCVVDVRTIPKSRHVPWFNQKRLKLSLNRQGIYYIHMIELGGLRKTSKDSINQGWRNSSFRGYADYMQTPAFFTALKELNSLLSQYKVAIMCAEAVPWRCHRSLIGDAEMIRGIQVLDIINANNPRPHKLTPFAVVNRSKRPIQIYYPK
jgi:uncharacterized protein (DUF488 family)